MNEFRQTLTSITRNLTKVSGELIKTTKINLSISGEEDRLKAVYVEIGKKVHEIYMYGGGLGKFFDEKYQEICAIEKKLVELRGQLNIASGTKTCAKCKNLVEKTAEFCPKCGTRMDSPEFMTGPSESAPVMEYPASHAEVVTVEEYPTGARVSHAYTEKEEYDDALSITSPTVSAHTFILCKACGATCGSNDKYCLSCGRLM